MLLFQNTEKSARADLPFEFISVLPRAYMTVKQYRDGNIGGLS